MATSPSPDPRPPDPEPMVMDVSDDHTVATPPKGTKTPSNDRVFLAYTLRFEMTASPQTQATQSSKAFSLAHTLALQQLLLSFPDSIQIFDNSNKKITSVNVVDWTSALLHESHFKIATKFRGKNRPMKLTLCHRVLSKVSFRDIRSHPAMMTLLKGNNIRMKRHDWSEDELDVVSPAYFIVNAAKHLPIDDATKKLQTLYARHQFSESTTPSGAPSPEKDRLDRVQQSLRQIRLNLLNYATKWGYSFDRWQVIVNVMIQKEQGNNKIHRLRVIHLYEADFQLLSSVKWRQLMQIAENQTQVNSGIYGARAFCDAKTPVFIEEMAAEISRASRKSMACMDKDATSCYDRILASFGAITSRKYGMDRNVTLVSTRTLKAAKYKLKTLLGVSDEYYQHSDRSPIYGTGQGSGNSPMIWALLSSTILDCYDSRSRGAAFATPSRSEFVKLHSTSFVDDSQSRTNDFFPNDQPSIDEIVHQMQEDTQLFNDLLWASGGALEIPKCSYHLFDWQFSASGAPVLASYHPDIQVAIRNEDTNETIQIPQMSAHSSRKTLGHYKGPSGNQKHQFLALKKKSDTLATFVTASPLSHSEAWTFYFAIYLPSITYPLSNCHLSIKHLDTIQRKATRILYAKCGYNRNTKAAILQGPTKYGGANFRPLWVEQGIGQLVSLLMHWRRETQAAKMSRVAVAWHQLSVGTSSSFLSDVHTPLPHLESLWFLSLRQFLRRVGGSLDLHHHGILPRQRRHDCYIMDVVLHSKRFTPAAIRSINYCRLYLQAVTLADISTPDGQRLDPAKQRGEVTLLSSESSLLYVNQPRPSESSWTMWRRACKLFTTRTGDLRTPLGPWTVTPTQARMRWTMYVCPSESYAYIWNHDKFDIYPITSESTTTVDPIDFTPRPPDESVPVEADPMPDGAWQIKHQCGVLEGPSIVPPAADFEAYLQSLEPWECTLFSSLTMVASSFEVATALSQATFDAASDGSVRSRNGTFGWVIRVSGIVLVECSGPVFGFSPSSYRAEAYGMLSFFRFIYHLTTFCSQPLPQGLRLHCDNVSLVNTIQSLSEVWYPPDPHDRNTLLFRERSHLANTLTADWDVINEIFHSLRDLQCPVRVLWVKGHQDDKTPMTALGNIAQMNVLADRLAEQFHDTFTGDTHVAHRFPHCTANLALEGGTLSTSLPKHLRYAATSPALEEYIQKRNQWDAQLFNSIDWESHRRSHHRHRSHKSHFVKMSHDLLPTNSLVHRYKSFRCASCVQCRFPVEDRDHILRCPNSVTWRVSFLRRLRRRCADLHTSPDVQDLLIYGIESWLNESAMDWSNVHPRVHSVCTAQRAIGWRQIFNGRFANEWTTAQTAYAKTANIPGLPQAASKWTTNIISFIWTEWRTLWDLHNDANHNVSETHRQSALRKELEAELIQVYDRRSDLLPRDRDLLHDDVDEHLRESTSSIFNWLSTFRPAFQSSVKAARQRARSGTQSILSYFGPRQQGPSVP